LIAGVSETVMSKGKIYIALKKIYGDGPTSSKLIKHMIPLQNDIPE
jgi:hypothetical protein